LLLDCVLYGEGYVTNKLRYMFVRPEISDRELDALHVIRTPDDRARLDRAITQVLGEAAGDQKVVRG
jgi:hypothetical protein